MPDNETVRPGSLSGLSQSLPKTDCPEISTAGVA